MIRLKIKNFNMILIEKLHKYQPCHHAKLLSMNILLVNKYDLLIKNKDNKKQVTNTNSSYYKNEFLLSKERETLVMKDSKKENI